MRKEIFRIVSIAELGDNSSRVYDLFIMFISIISVIPLAFRMVPEQLALLLNYTEIICVYILFLDYILHWMTHDYKIGRDGILPFVLYPFSPMAVIDLVALLPSLGWIPVSFKVLRLLRLTKFLTYSRSCARIVKVFKKEQKTLYSVLMIAVFYIFISALIMFQNEPAETFGNFFDALYWSTTALTTVGYGDYYPHSDVGKLISMVSSLFGIAVIALPAGIVTAGFVDVIQDDIQENEELKVSQANRQGRKMAKEDKRKYLIVMALGTIINLIFYSAARIFDLPLFMNSVGTGYAAMMLDPAAGLLVGYIYNFFEALLIYGPESMIYYITTAVTAIGIGLRIRKEGIIEIRRLPTTVLIITVINTIISGCLTILRTRGSLENGWEAGMMEIMMGNGIPRYASYFLSAFALKLIDAAILIIALYILYKITPDKRYIVKRYNQ